VEAATRQLYAGLRRTACAYACIPDSTCLRISLYVLLVTTACGCEYNVECLLPGLRTMLDLERFSASAATHA
jgi:hypothetical protein